MRDLVAGTTIRASVDAGGGDPNGQSGPYSPSISADGWHVAFSSDASDLVEGDENGTNDIFVRDLVAGTTVRASVDTGGGDPDGSSRWPSMSSDGRYPVERHDGRHTAIIAARRTGMERAREVRMAANRQGSGSTPAANEAVRGSREAVSQRTPRSRIIGPRS